MGKGFHPEKPPLGVGRALGPSLLLTHLCLCWQPERINPELNQKGYSVKSDIWSLGITMVPSPGGCQGGHRGSWLHSDAGGAQERGQGWREGGWSCWDVQAAAAGRWQHGLRHGRWSSRDCQHKNPPGTQQSSPFGTAGTGRLPRSVLGDPSAPGWF